MPVVKMPNGDLVEMPDNPSPEQLTALQSIVKKQAGQDWTQNVSKTDPMIEGGKVFDKAVRGGLLSLPGFVGDALSGTTNFIMRKTGMMPDIEANHLGKPGMPMWPSDALQTLTGGKLSEPETPTGKVVGNIGQATVAGASAGPLANLGRNAVIGLSSGIGSEVAAKAFGDEAIPRIVGGLVGGGLPVIGRKLIPLNAKDVIDTATSKMTDTDWTVAKALEKAAAEHKIPGLASQFLGPRSSLDDVVDVASRNQFVRPELLTATADVPEKSKRALEVFLAGNVEPRLSSSRQFMDEVQQEASKAIDQSRKADSRTWTSAFAQKLNENKSKAVQGVQAAEQGVAKARQHLDSLPADAKLFDLASGKAAVNEASKAVAPAIEASREVTSVPVSSVREAYKNLSDMAKQFPNTSKAEVYLGLRDKLMHPDGGFITDGFQLNEILKDARASLEAQSRSANPINTAAAGAGKEAIKDLRDSLGKAFEPIQAANKAFQIRRSTVTEPMEKGLVGQFAQMGGGIKPDKYTARGNALSMMFPKDRDMSKEIKDFAAQTNPDTVSAMLGEHLRNEMEKAVTLTKGADRVQQPFDFVKAVAGTSAQRKNLQASFKVIAEANGADSSYVMKGFYKLMRVMESTKDLKISNSLNSADVDRQAGKSAADALALMSRITRRVADRVTAKTYGDVVKIITSPDGVRKLEAIAKAPKPQDARALTMSLISEAQNGNTNAETAQPPQ